MHYFDKELQETTPPDRLTTLSGWFSLAPFQLGHYTDGLEEKVVAFGNVDRLEERRLGILLLGVEPCLAHGSLGELGHHCNASTYTPDVLFYIGCRVGKWGLLPDLQYVHGPREGFEHCAAVGASYAAHNLSVGDRVLWHCKIEAVAVAARSDDGWGWGYGNEMLVGSPVSVELLSEPVRVAAGDEFHPEN